MYNKQIISIPIRLARKIIGALILSLDKITSPKKTIHSAEKQTLIDQNGIQVAKYLGPADWEDQYFIDLFSKYIF